jgi:hypothetical protein
MERTKNNGQKRVFAWVKEPLHRKIKVKSAQDRKTMEKTIEAILEEYFDSHN